MGVRGTKPTDGPKHFRGGLTHEWTDVPDEPYTGKVPVRLPAKVTVHTDKGPKSVPLTAMTRAWWKAIRAMPHCRLWALSDWHYALATAIVADNAFRGATGAATELRQREKTLGTTADARRDLRIRYVEPVDDAPAAPVEQPAAQPAQGATVTPIRSRAQQLIG